MRRKLLRIGVQPSAPAPPPEPAPADVRSCDTCRFNRKASIYSAPPHELIIHCSGRIGVGYTTLRTNCHGWEASVNSYRDLPLLCRDCVHAQGSIGHPVHGEAISCEMHSIQLIAYASRCREYRNEEMQAHYRRAAEEEAMQMPDPPRLPWYARLRDRLMLWWSGYNA